MAKTKITKNITTKKFDLNDVKKKVKARISEIAEVPLKDLKDDARFAEDLGVDSMMALEIVASIEKQFKIVIPEDMIPKIRTFQNVYEILEELIKK
jgi:acyl carrier protein